MSANSDTLPLAGGITFERHTALRARLDAFVDAGGGTVDWSGVEELDSSALSLVFHASRTAAAHGRAVRHVNLPPALDALAELYGVRALLDG